MEKTIDQNLKKIEHQLLSIKAKENNKKRNQSFFQSKSTVPSRNKKRFDKKYDSKRHQNIPREAIKTSSSFANTVENKFNCSQSITFRRNKQNPASCECVQAALKNQGFNEKDATSFVPHNGNFYCVKIVYLFPPSHQRLIRGNRFSGPSNFSSSNITLRNYSKQKNIRRKDGKQKMALENNCKLLPYTSQSYLVKSKKTTQEGNLPSLRHLQQVKQIDTHERSHKQIDPYLSQNCFENNDQHSYFTSQLLLNEDSLERNRRLQTNFAPENQETDQRSVDESKTCPSLFRRFLSNFKNSMSFTQESNSLSSGSNINLLDNLFCWTCLEMTGDDDSLSSVDSGS